MSWFRYFVFIIAFVAALAVMLVFVPVSRAQDSSKPAPSTGSGSVTTPSLSPSPSPGSGLLNIPKRNEKDVFSIPEGSFPSVPVTATNPAAPAPAPTAAPAAKPVAGNTADKKEKKPDLLPSKLNVGSMREVVVKEGNKRPAVPEIKIDDGNKKAEIPLEKILELIPYEVREELLSISENYRSDCDTNFVMRNYYDCDCLALEALSELVRGAPSELTPDQPLAMVNLSQQRVETCISPPAIAGHIYDRCERVLFNDSKLTDKVLEATCECTAREMANYFVRYPENNTYILDQRFNSVMIMCQKDSGLDLTRRGIPGQ